MQNSNIKVSVCVVTYNQEKYIGECLDSLVSQQTDFLFEIIVGDDASSDRTPEIIQEYYEKYPEIIIPVLRDKNLGPVGNTVDVYKRAKGRYIAHLDGDDMALPGKLQSQADALDVNPDSIICSHDVYLLEEKLSSKTFRKMPSGKYGLMDLYAQLPFFAHSSKMFRNDLTELYWNKLSVTALDVTIHVEQVKRGSILHLEELLGVYRINTGIAQINSRLNSIIPQEVSKIFEEAETLQNIDVALIQKLHAKAYFEFAYQSALFGNANDLQKYITISMRISQYDIKQVIFYYMRCMPRLIIMLCKYRQNIKNNSF